MTRHPDTGALDVPELVARAKAGEHRAINQLTTLFWDEIKEGLERRWYPPRYDPSAEAEDLTQKTFIKLGEALEGYAESGRFRGWLHRVAFHMYKTRLRSVLRQGLETLHTSAGNVPSEQETLFPTGKQELRELVERLPHGEREAWTLYAAGYKHPEIAERLGIAHGASYARVSRAKDRLIAMVMASRQKNRA